VAPDRYLLSTTPAGRAEPQRPQVGLSTIDQIDQDWLQLTWLHVYPKPF
jgi:hypothetical protein